MMGFQGGMPLPPKVRKVFKIQSLGLDLARLYVKY
jgi:hypothetical protein